MCVCPDIHIHLSDLTGLDLNCGELVTSVKTPVLSENLFWPHPQHEHPTMPTLRTLLSFGLVSCAFGFNVATFQVAGVARPALRVRPPDMFIG